MRRSVIVTVTAAVALLVGAVAGWAAAGFSDVSSDSPHVRAIKWAAASGVIVGKHRTRSTRPRR